MFKKILIFFFLAFSLLIFNSCTSNNKVKIEPKVKIELEVLYKQALINFQNGNYNDSLTLFEKVEKDYSYTEWAPKALLMRSYINYDSNEYIKALTLLQRFKKFNPGHKNFDYAEYLIAICMFEQINFVALSQEPTELALKQFKKIISDYPKSNYVNDARFKIDLINEQLAAKEMYLARYYSKRDKWVPALYRLNIVLEKYQNTIFIEEALHRLVEINFKLGNINSAKKYAAILGYNYNSSDWYKKSYKILNEKNIEIEKNKEKKTLKEKIKQIIQMK